MAVVLQHFSATAQQWCSVSIPSLVPHGYVAVDFFFVLSGFIMSYTYLAGFERDGPAAYRAFLAKRVARIVPLNLFALFLVLAAGTLSLTLSGTNPFFAVRRPLFDIAANVLMLQGLGVGSNLNGPSWSISTEFAAYLLFPAFVFLIFKSRALLWATVAVSVCALTCLAIQQPRLVMTGEGGAPALIRCFAEFMLGMGAYRLSNTRYEPILSRDAVTIGLSLLAAGFLLIRCDLPAVLLFPLVVLSFARNTGLAATLAGSAPIHFLGLISFSIYLLHNLTRPLGLQLVQAIAPEPVGPVAALAFAAIGSCSVIPIGWLAFVAIERPGRILIANLLARQQIGAMASIRSPSQKGAIG